MNKNEILGMIINYATWDKHNDEIEFNEKLTGEDIKYIMNSFNKISKDIKIELYNSVKENHFIFRYVNL